MSLCRIPQLSRYTKAPKRIFFQAQPVRQCYPSVSYIASKRLTAEPRKDIYDNTMMFIAPSLTPNSQGKFAWQHLDSILTSLLK